MASPATVPAATWTRRELWTRKLLYPGHTLPTAIAPILVAIGLAMHDGVFAAAPAAIAFLAGWLIQFAGVVTDNYTNLVHQPDDREHPELVHALASGSLSLGTLRATILACHGAALALGVVLVTMAGPPVIVIGLASIVASWAYSSGPFPIGKHGLADPLFFLFFGTVPVVGTYFVQASAVLGPLPWRELLPMTVVAASLPVGALSTGILIIDDIRDVAFDAVKGKRTVAVRWGVQASRRELVALLAFAYLAPVWLWRGLGFSPWVLLPALTLPFAVRIARTVWTEGAFAALVPMTPRLARLTVVYAAGLALGLAVPTTARPGRPTAPAAPTSPTSSAASPAR